MVVRIIGVARVGLALVLGGCGTTDIAQFVLVKENGQWRDCSP